jgi:two-component system, chemotaxis family, sensor kinase Cph1
MNNTRNLDAEFCGKVPLHQTNLIQPHGVLVVVKQDDWSILQASENAETLFSKPVAELIRETLNSFLSPDDRLRLEAMFNENLPNRLPFVFSVAEKRYLGVVEQQEGFFVLEIEKTPQAEEGSSFVAIYQEVKRSMAVIEACTTTDDTCRVVAKELKRLSGFDKVMVYRFDEHWNGDVVAEEMEPGMESYMGLKFPASDIPKQARELYKKTPYRLIPAIDYEAVKLYPVLNPLTGAFTNLSNSNLRSVAPVHLEYLRNMKVNASMSTRILKDGELWGLIACHHRTPKYLSYEMCSVFELLSNVIAAKISAVEARDSFQHRSAKQDLQNKLVEAVLSNGGLGGQKSTLLQLLDADGVAIMGHGRVETEGSTPEAQEIEDIVYWLQANGVTGLYHQPSLPAVYEAAQSYAAKGSGLLALPIEEEKDHYVLAFRPESVKKISWGGNPDEAVQFESDGKKYHPRASFKIWQETVRHTSQSWKEETLEAAEKLRNFLIDARLNKRLSQ